MMTPAMAGMQTGMMPPMMTPAMAGMQQTGMMNMTPLMTGMQTGMTNA
jgi:hypothetical protein